MTVHARPINQIIIPERTSNPQSDFKNEIFATLDNGTIMSIGLTNPDLPASGSVYKPDSPILATTFLDNDALLVTSNEIQRIKMVDAKEPTRVAVDGA